MHEESLESDNSSASTTESTVTENTKQTQGRISVNSAKFREFDAILIRQKQDADHAAAKSSERISTIERQLHRFNNLDKKLSDLQQDISCRFNLFEGRLLETMKDHIGQSGSNLSAMESRMAKLMSVVETILDKKLPAVHHSEETTEEVHGDVLACTVQEGTIDHSNRSDSIASDGSAGSRPSAESSSSGSSLGTASMDAESIGIIQSPEHKGQRSSGKQKTLPDSIRRHLDRQRFSKLQPNESDTPQSESSAVDPTSNSTPPHTPTKHDNTEDDKLLTPRSPTPPPDNPDPESQYKGKTLPPKDNEHLSTTGNISHRRGSRG